MQRRHFLQLLASAAVTSNVSPAGKSQSVSRAYGLLIGGLIGDALGGPIEFSSAGPNETGLCGAREWPEDRKLDQPTLKSLGESLPLLSYEKLRPDVAPYGQWTLNAPAGTVTDDSRHKIVLLDAVRGAVRRKTELTSELIAQAFLDFKPAAIANDRVQELNAEGFREYRFAARWLLGERDLKLAKPIERLWAGVNNCSGQMMLPPLAVAYAGDPISAYQKAFDIDFIDAPMARDIAAALVAALAAVLNSELDNASVERRWEIFCTALRHTDPYDFQKVPFAGRQLNRWLDKADELVERADGRPRELYKLLETEGKPVFWWDAHFTLLVPLCMLKLCSQNAMAAMHLTLDFGHDTDSYAQILGCIVGAIHGPEVFPQSMSNAVCAQLLKEYGEDVTGWEKVLKQLAV